MCALQVPTLNLPSKQEAPSLQPGGLLEQSLKKKGVECTTVAFADMQHGWVTRGDMADPNCARDVPRAIELTADFLHKHLDLAEREVGVPVLRGSKEA